MNLWQKIKEESESSPLSKFQKFQQSRGEDKEEDETQRLYRLFPKRAKLLETEKEKISGKKSNYLETWRIWENEGREKEQEEEVEEANIVFVYCGVNGTIDFDRYYRIEGSSSTSIHISNLHNFPNKDLITCMYFVLADLPIGHILCEVPTSTNQNSGWFKLKKFIFLRSKLAPPLEIYVCPDSTLKTFEYDFENNPFSLTMNQSHVCPLNIEEIRVTLLKFLLNTEVFRKPLPSALNNCCVISGFNNDRQSVSLVELRSFMYNLTRLEGDNSAPFINWRIVIEDPEYSDVKLKRKLKQPFPLSDHNRRNEFYKISKDKMISTLSLGTASYTNIVSTQRRPCLFELENIRRIDEIAPPYQPRFPYILFCIDPKVSGEWLEVQLQKVRSLCIIGYIMIQMDINTTFTKTYKKT